MDRMSECGVIDCSRQRHRDREAGRQDEIWRSRRRKGERWWKMDGGGGGETKTLGCVVAAWADGGRRMLMEGENVQCAYVDFSWKSTDGQIEGL